MADKAYLVLESGQIFEGKYFGKKADIVGEIVFATSMTGYLETLTDPSYYGQIVVQTFPLIGNYGVIPSDFESDKIGPRAYIVKDWCQQPSNFRSEGNIDTFFVSQNMTGLYDIDTRALTKIIREQGVMNGKICSEVPADLKEIKDYKIVDAVKSVSTRESYLVENPKGDKKVVLMDFGTKKNIARELQKRGCSVTVMPHDASPEEILAIKPDGIMLSNGPGDPAENTVVIENLRELIEHQIPTFGICLGHQLLALANGFKTEKLKYGHRGANQPAKNVKTGRVYITSQNHGYAVVSGSIDPKIAEELFVNVNDHTCEGVLYKNVPAFTVQFHPEACGGPKDSGFLFDEFMKLMEVKRDAT